MKLISMVVLSAQPTLPDPIILAAEHDVSSFSYFQRKSVQEMSVFLARNTAKKAIVGERSSLDHEGHTAHYFLKGNGLIAFVMTDQEYPDRKAHSLVTLTLQKFEETFKDWKSEKADKMYDFPWLKDALRQYQNPDDKVGQTLREIDDVKRIMHKNIEQTLGRGDDLDMLVHKSEDLSARSKQFYKQTKALPKHCCSIQ
ncbi:V-SNARE coiled-coil homology domain-containing protein [Plasmodiophora brassicae]|uniref:V-SNARE coiled-coil homology domain-containing protein n=1 Tax=Plasmodiophora brassicae TaxID=37360 RepID=A0A3P3YMD9_PLABS|nr:unnamed protein product [Plasmodiophora brassicae]